MRRICSMNCGRVRALKAVDTGPPIQAGMRMVRCLDSVQRVF